MRFSPQSEEQLNQEREERMKLLKPGRGQFTVLNGEQKEKDGSEYLMLVCQVWDSENHSRQIKNVYLGPKMMWQFRHFCYAVGLGEQYEMGNVELEDVVNKSGECEIEIEKGDVNPKGGRFPDKNRIKDYYVPENVRQTPNYQASKQQQVNGGGGGSVNNPGGQNQRPPVEDTPACRAMINAMNTFIEKAKAAGMVKEAYTEAWKDAEKDYFRGKPRQAISEQEWNQFVKDEFSRPVASPPFSETAQFKEADIPF